MDGALIEEAPEVIVNVPCGTKSFVSSMRLGCNNKQLASKKIFLIAFGASQSITILPLVGYARVGTLAVGSKEDLYA
jgi:putative Mn2+ efflux pump MntP